jgi:hypothetical protein
MRPDTATITDDAPVAICAGPTDANQPDPFTRSFAVKNVTASAVIYLGERDVTSTTGFPWDATTDGPLSIDCEPGETLYGILASGQPDQTVKTLEQGR